jgi:two-component system chemotaxis response regulator CheB
LFDSVAETAKAKAIGVILTGMGSDGAKGLLNMKKQGAYTIGQDEHTSIVYGMPMVAYNIGGVCKQLPLEKISQEICNHLSLTM